METLEVRTLLSTITVTSLADNLTVDGQVTLREAIQAANTDTTVDGVTGSGADTIVFAPSLTSGGPATIRLNGTELAITSDVTVSGLGAANLAISGEGLSRVFQIDAGNTVTISGLTIEHGKQPNVDPTGDGGGIRNLGTLTVSDCVFANNFAGRIGGAISLGSAGSGAAVTVNHTTFTDNFAGYVGGAIGADYSSTITVNNSEFSGNNAGSPAYFDLTGFGGGGALQINSFGNMTVNNSTFVNNFSYVSGGAVFSSGSATIVNSTFFGNDAGTEASTPWTGGGALGMTWDGSYTVVNSTLAGNTSHSVAGGIQAAGSVVLKNTIVAENTLVTGSTPSDISGSVTAMHSLIGNTGGVSFAGGSANNITDTPALLGPLGNYGGPTQTMALLVGSPAIDAGSNALAVDNLGNPLTTDQRGSPFGRVLGTSVDIGAVERQTVTSAPFPLVVSTLQDENDEDYSLGDLSLREAIGLANGSVGTETITFASGLTSGGLATIRLNGTELQIRSDMTITGPGASLLTINGDSDNNGTGNSRIFNIDDGVGSNTNIVRIAGLTLTNGYTSQAGGAVLNAENVTLVDCTISNSHAEGNGGGVANNFATAEIRNCLLTGNSASGVGGGFFNFASGATVVDSTFDGNSATSQGGGIANWFSLTGTLSPMVAVSNSTFVGNRANLGGGLFDWYATTSLTNCTLSANVATTDGGGVYDYIYGGSSLTNCTVAGNSAGSNGGGMYAYPGYSNYQSWGLANNIVAGNTAIAGPDFFGATLSNGFNLIGDARDSTGWIAQDLLSVDPLLLPLANNGGPTQTMGLYVDSPAINAAGDGHSLTYPWVGGTPPTDQRGTTRDAHPDIGAFEYVPISVAVDSHGNLIITDTLGIEDVYMVSVVGGDLVITNSSQPFGSAPFGGTLSNGGQTLTIPMANIPGDVVINAGVGDDSLTVDFSGSTQLPDGTLTFNGGSGGHDTMTLANGSVDSIEHVFTNEHDGFLKVNGVTLIGYTGLEPIIDNLSVTDRVFTFNGGAETIAVTDGTASDGMTRIDSTLGESVNFVNPTGSLTINVGSGDDTVTITSVDAAYHVDLTINGDADADTVNLNADITFASGESLIVNAESLNTGAGADLTTSGAGVITVTADDVALHATSTLVSAGTVTIQPQTATRAINLGTNTAGSLSLTDTELDRVTASTLQIGDANSGTITVSTAITHSNNLSLTTGEEITVNQAITMATDKNLTASAVSTISLSGANSDLAASGSGSLTLTTQRNIFSNGASIVSSSGAILLQANQQVVPTSGSFAGIIAVGGTIQSTSGDITLKGRGGDGAGGLRFGIEMYGGSVVGSGTTGTVTVVGTGGASTGAGNYGVYVANPGATITSGGGDVMVTGQGGGVGTSGANYGVYLSGGTIQAGGTGTITVDGTGGTGSGAENTGVVVTSSSSIRSSAGAVKVTGHGEGSGAATDNYGVVVAAQSTITAGGTTGAVTVEGTGGATTGDSNFGVYLRTGSSITSGGGAVNVTGHGGGGGSGGVNVGVSVIIGSVITAGGTGLVTVVGTGGASTGAGNYGVYVANPGATITSGGGDVMVTGQGGGTDTSSSNVGVYALSGGKITAGGVGKVTVDGTGGATSGSNNHGSRVESGGSTITSTGGDVTVIGQGVGAAAIEVDASASIGVGGSGNLLLIGDSMFVSANGSITAGANTATLRPKTVGTAINVGGADGVGTLGLNVTELDRVTAGTLQIGDSNTGLITVSAALVPTSHLSLTSGSGGIDINASVQTLKSFSLTTVGSGNITVDAPVAVLDPFAWRSADDVVLNADVVGGNSLEVSAGRDGSGSVFVSSTGALRQPYGGNPPYFVNSGGVSGDISLDGPLVASFAMFLGASGGSIHQASGGSVTTPHMFATAGHDILLDTSATNDIDYLSARSLADGDIRVTNAGTLEVQGFNTINFANVTTAGGNVVLSASGANADLNVVGNVSSMGGDVTLNSGRKLGLNDGVIASAGGSVQMTAGTSIDPATTGTEVNAAAATLSFGNGSDLAIAIEGTTVDSAYRQLNVVGVVDLRGVDLSVSGSYVPQTAETFTIVRNDGSDAVIGNFNGLVDGSRFSFNGIKLQITYQGGDGNDVVLIANRAPVAEDGLLSVVAGTSATGNVVATDAEGDSLTYRLVHSADAHGQVVVRSDGSFTYTPDPLFFGAASFTVVANDGAVDSNEATVLITVGGGVLVTLPDIAGQAFRVFREGNNLVVWRVNPLSPTQRLARYFTQPGSGDIRVLQIEGGSEKDNVSFDASLAGYFTGTAIFNGNQGNDRCDARVMRTGVVLNGGLGNDTLLGGRANDSIDGGAGDDSLLGNAGQDLLFGRDGEDTILGGSGGDTIYGGDDDDDIYGGDQGANGGDGDDELHGEGGDDLIKGGLGHDTACGDAGNDQIQGDAGNDLLIGGEGDDVINGNRGLDTVLGGRGNDTLYGGTHNDQLLGQEGDDLILGHGGDDRIDGGSGNDTLRGLEGNDKIFGGSGDDKIAGGRGNDLLVGGTGNDYLHGGELPVSVYATPASDRIFGSDGNDVLHGGIDTDIVNGGNGTNAVYQDGLDTIADLFTFDIDEVLAEC